MTTTPENSVMTFCERHMAYEFIFQGELMASVGMATLLAADHPANLMYEVAEGVARRVRVKKFVAALAKDDA